MTSGPGVRAHLKGTMSSAERKTGPQDIAIVGMASVFPKAHDVREYWQNLVDKVDGVTDGVPEWTQHYYDPEMKEVARIYTKKGGFVDRDLPFDPLEFGIMPSQVDGTTPDHFLALKACKDALIDAGYWDGMKSFDKTRTGVILGYGPNANRGNLLAFQHGMVVDQTMAIIKNLMPDMDEQMIYDIRHDIMDGLPMLRPEIVPGFVANVLTGRIANRLDLMGPNYIVDAACSASFISLDASIKELRSGRSDMILAGGVNMSMPPQMMMVFSIIEALTRENVRPFDKNASGVLLGEGMGIFVLKRLEDAERDDDRIYAVIKGIALASDGKSKGLLAPRFEGEVLAMQRAYEEIGIDKHSISLLEAHGTGIPLGDETEVKSIKTVFGDRPEDGLPIGLGGVKSMLGHSLMAAGSAGMIKTVLGLYHKSLPPTLCDEVNQALELETSPVYVNNKIRPWINGQDHPRRAGVNAFGFGGIDGHCIVEEYTGSSGKDRVKLLDNVWPHELLVFHGRSQDDVVEQVNNVIGVIQHPRNFFLKDIAYSLIEKAKGQFGPVRLAVLVTDNRGDAVKRLQDAVEKIKAGKAERMKGRGGIFFGDKVRDGKMAFIYPGHGAQYPEMFADLCRFFPQVREWFDVMDRLFVKNMGIRPSDALYPKPTVLTDEERAELAKELFTGDYSIAITNYTADAMDELVRDTLGVKPDVMIGHSTGELNAVGSSGYFKKPGKFELDEPTELLVDVFTSFRDELGGYPTGALLAVGAADHKKVEKIIADSKGKLSFVLDNCPNQVLIYGAEEDVLNAKPLFEKAGGICERMPFDRAFHTPEFKLVSEKLAKRFKTDWFDKGHTKLFSATKGGYYPDDPKKVHQWAADLWSEPVMFRGAIEKLYEDGVRIFVEVGANANLTAFVNDTLMGKDYLAVATNNARKGDLDQLNTMLAQLFINGRVPRFEGMYEHREVNLVPVNPAEIEPEKKRPTNQRLVRDVATMRLSDKMMQRLNEKYPHRGLTGAGAANVIPEAAQAAKTQDQSAPETAPAAATGNGQPAAAPQPQAPAQPQEMAPQQPPYDPNGYPQQQPMLDQWGNPLPQQPGFDPYAQPQQPPVYDPYGNGGFDPYTGQPLQPQQGYPQPQQYDPYGNPIPQQPGFDPYAPPPPPFDPYAAQMGYPPYPPQPMMDPWGNPLPLQPGFDPYVQQQPQYDAWGNPIPPAPYNPQPWGPDFFVPGSLGVPPPDPWGYQPQAPMMFDAYGNPLPADPYGMMPPYDPYGRPPFDPYAPPPPEMGDPYAQPMPPQGFDPNVAPAPMDLQAPPAPVMEPAPAAPAQPVPEAQAPAEPVPAAAPPAPVAPVSAEPQADVEALRAAARAAMNAHDVPFGKKPPVSQEMLDALLSDPSNPGAPEHLLKKVDPQQSLSAPKYPRPVSSELPFEQAYPLLGKVVSKDENLLECERHLNVETDLVLKSHAFGGPPSRHQRELRPMAIVPFVMSLETCAEAATYLMDGKKHVKTFKMIRGHRWLALTDGTLDILIKAKKLKDLDDGDTLVRVEIFQYHKHRDGRVEPHLTFETMAIVGDKEHEPVAPMPFQVPNPKYSHFTTEMLYNDGIFYSMNYPGRFHGRHFRAIRNIRHVSPHTIEVDIEVPDWDDLFANIQDPQFQTDIFVMDAAVLQVGFYYTEVYGMDANLFPFMIKEAKFFGGPPPKGRKLIGRAVMRLTGIGDIELDSNPFFNFQDKDGNVIYQMDDHSLEGFHFPPEYYKAVMVPNMGCLEGTVDIIDAETGHVYTHIEGWQNRFFDMPVRFDTVTLFMHDFTLSEPWLTEKTGMRMRINEPFEEGLLEESWGVWGSKLAHTMLTEAEKKQYYSFPEGNPRREDWLMGRIAAKELLIDWIMKETIEDRYNPIDIEIRIDEHGKPYGVCTPLPELKLPDFSLAHSKRYAVTVCARDLDTSVGIDYEWLDGFNYDDVLAGGFAKETMEQVRALPEDQRTRATAALWCSKEAVAKALGSGMNYEPREWAIDSYDLTAGTASVRYRDDAYGTRFWFTEAGEVVAVCEIAGRSVPRESDDKEGDSSAATTDRSGDHSALSAPQVADSNGSSAPAETESSTTATDDGIDWDNPDREPTELEEQLIELWEELLDIDDVGLQDDFFELGGESVLAVRLIGRVEKLVGRSIPVANFLKTRTVAQMAKILSDEDWAPDWSSLVPLRATGERLPLFFTHPVGGNVLKYRELISFIPEEQPLYALQARGLDGEEEPFDNVPEMAEYYLKGIRAAQEEGPYLLAGFSGGGVISWEMAYQLEQAGEEVAMLALFDTFGPGYYTFEMGGSRLPHQLETFLWRIELHLETMATLSITQKIDYVKRKLKHGNRKSRGGSGGTIRKVEDMTYEAVLSYEPKKLETVPVHLFRASHQPKQSSGDELLNWGPYVGEGNLTVHQVHGTHGHLVEQPHVDGLANVLNEVLDGTHARLEG